MTDNNETTSFLHESQLAGKASGGKMALENWEDAMNDLTHIKNDDVADVLRKTDYEEWPAQQMATYCQDCHKIVTPEIKSFRRGRSKKSFERMVCSVCGSKKIATGREDALKGFYHINDKEEKTNKPKEATSKSKKPESPKKSVKPARPEKSKTDNTQKKTKPVKK